MPAQRIGIGSIFQNGNNEFYMIVRTRNIINENYVNLVNLSSGNTWHTNDTRVNLLSDITPEEISRLTSSLDDSIVFTHVHGGVVSLNINATSPNSRRNNISTYGIIQTYNPMNCTPKPTENNNDTNENITVIPRTRRRR